MTVDRWSRLEALVHEALQRSAADRAAFLDAACAGDSTLRQDAESLLARASAASGFLETPAAGARRGDVMIGAMLGPYRVLDKLGAGGMGEVYRARDDKLRRDVALKILPPAFVADPDRLARFRREAQVLAVLNHPNIGHIYGFEDPPSTSTGQVAPHALVLELVEGPTLADRMARGPIALADALPIARQIALALEAAHDRGIVHRDLKPANVKVRGDGMVKVLDFGLAKALDATGGSGPDADASTVTSPAATERGMILGTAAYMSPEQARGQSVDKRTDIWAFGVVLYEMLTGRRAFAGGGVTDVLAAVLRQDVDWAALPAGTPPRLRGLLERCLDRDVKTRLRDIGEARIAIDRSEAGEPAEAAAAGARAADDATSVRRKTLPWQVASAALAAGLLAVLVLWAPWTSPPPAQPMRLTVVPPAALPIARTNVDREVAISPDGTRIAYVSDAAADRLVVRAIDRLDAEAVPGTTGARIPFFSPDGKWIGFFGQSELKKVPVAGGPALTVCRITSPPRGASWGSDDTIVFATTDPATGLFLVRAGGGEPQMISKPDLARGEGDHQHPVFLPGSRAVLFTIHHSRVEDDEVAALDLKTGRYKTLIHGGSEAEYVAPVHGAGRAAGSLVYAAAGSLRAVRFDAARLEVQSDPVPVVEQVMMVSSGASEFSVSQTGTLVYVPGGFNAAGIPRSLGWVDRQGHETPIVGAPARAYSSLRLSPDGTRLALGIGDQEFDVWLWDLARAKLTRLTTDPGWDAVPVWTPDGRRIAFSGAQGGTAANLFWQAGDGTGAPERLTTSEHVQNPLSFTPDGTRLIFRETTNDTGEDISLLTLATRQVTPLLHTSEAERSGEISPNGQFVAYERTESGLPQIYVQPFPAVSAGRWQVSESSAGGSMPVWAPNGRELFYVSGGAIYAVPVQMSPGFTGGNPVKLFDLGWAPQNGANGRMYDVTRDGQRFVVIRDVPASDSPGSAPAPKSIVVVVNWTQELAAKVGLR